jgi:hypothetical protein
MNDTQAQTVSQSEHTTLPQIASPISEIGANESNPILMHLEKASSFKVGTNSENQLLNLKSNVSPHVILEKPPEIRVIKVSKADIKALSQVVAEFKEQFIEMQ